MTFSPRNTAPEQLGLESSGVIETGCAVGPSNGTHTGAPHSAPEKPRKQAQVPSALQSPLPLHAMLVVAFWFAGKQAVPHCEGLVSARAAASAKRARTTALGAGKLAAMAATVYLAMKLPRQRICTLPGCTIFIYWELHRLHVDVLMLSYNLLPHCCRVFQHFG